MEPQRLADEAMQRVLQEPCMPIVAELAHALKDSLERVAKLEEALRKAGLFLQVMVDSYATDMTPEEVLAEVRAALEREQELREERALSEEYAGHDMLADEWREWAEGGKAWSLQKRIAELEEALRRTLSQWRMYANDDRQHDGQWIERANDPEARLFQNLTSVLISTEEEE